MNVNDVKNIAAAALPAIRAALDAAEELAAISDAATAKGIDWSQLKGLLTAQEKDARDGGDGKRVARIVEKADFASAYADMLGLREDERASGEIVHPAGSSGGAEPVIKPAPAPPDLDIPDYLRRTRPSQGLDGALPGRVEA